MEDLSIPMNTGNANDQHGQIMFALGQIKSDIRGVQQRQDITNGKVLKAELDINIMKQDKAKDEGEKEGSTAVWKLLYTIGGIIVGAISMYLTFHHQ